MVPANDLFRAGRASVEEPPRLLAVREFQHFSALAFSTILLYCKHSGRSRVYERQLRIAAPNLSRHPESPRRKSGGAAHTRLIEVISHAHSDELFSSYKAILVGIIRSLHPRRIAEIAGASPSISLHEIAALDIYESSLSDISRNRDRKDSGGYDKQVCDVCDPEVPTGYDLVSAIS